MAPPAAPTTYRFGRFQLDLARRELSAAGVPVALSSRAFDVLQLLIEHRDRVVTKDEMMSVVWRGSIVEDNNLAVQISSLRRAVEQRPGQPAVIVTVPGRGYRFVASVEELQVASGPLATEEPPSRLTDAEPQTPAAPPAVAPAHPLQPRVGLRSAAGLAAVLLAGIALFAPLRNWLRPKEAPRLSIVVMPFRNLTGDSKQDYLADAVSDNLTTDLSHIPGSLVIARETADAYKGRAVPANVIGRALNVRYLMDGSLTAIPSGVHINAQLVDTSTNGHLWADTFDVARDKIGDAQAAIVPHIATAMSYKLVDVESARSLRERPDNPDAVDLYLQARSVLDRDTSMSGLQRARALLQKSVAIDDTFSEALSEFGRTLLRIISIDDPDEIKDFSLAKTSIMRAIALSPRDPHVILANGSLLSAEENCQAAIPQFVLAVQMEPNNVDARAALGECALRSGQPALMLEQLEAIQRVDPQGASYGKRLEKQGMCHLLLQRADKALSFLDQAVAQASQMRGRPSRDLGWEEFASLFDIAAKIEVGKADAAARVYANYKAQWPNRSVWRLGTYFSKSLQEQGGFAAYERALIQAGMPEFTSDGETQVSADGTGDFQPMPQHLAGADVVDTKELIHLLKGNPSLMIVDVGHGAATIPSAAWIGDEGLLKQPLNLVIEKRTKYRKLDIASPIVVMGDGPFGSASYDQAQQLLSMGFQKVVWFRGGEESWRASGQPYKDRRFQ